MGTCQLCRQPKDLVESHLLPKALYKILRSLNENGGYDHPVSVSNASAVQTSKQVTQHALCDECEHLFDKHGENTVVAECLRNDDEFLLRSKLRKNEPDWQDVDEEWFSGAALTDVDVEAYRYFALSVYWRASAIRWKNHAKKTFGILGSKYEERFRKYLLGEASFPDEAILTVFVANEDKPPQYMSAPSSARDCGFYTHDLQVPGLYFRLFLGNAIRPQIADSFRALQTNCVFLLHDSTKTPAHEHVVRYTLSRELKGKLAKQSWD